MTAVNQFDFAYTLALPKRLRGQSNFGLGKVTHKMVQNIVGVNYTYYF
jgi:hypothetical protein